MIKPNNHSENLSRHIYITQATKEMYVQRRNVYDDE